MFGFGRPSSLCGLVEIRIYGNRGIKFSSCQDVLKKYGVTEKKHRN
jgi:hypothetical protein